VSRPGSSDTLPAWLGWLETLSPREIDLGLDRVNEVLSRLAPGRPERLIVVAGTNGKGSSVAMLEALYLQRSDSVAAYTSPHIHRYNERIRIGGVNATDAAIVEAFVRVERVRGDVPLTYFEYGTLAALDQFDRAGIRHVILEVGLGGRLDAVNAVEPDGGILTNVAMDHQDWLGHDIESIAAEKAGILRPFKPFVFASDEVPRAVIERALELDTDLRILNRDYRYDLGEPGWNFRGRSVSIDGLRQPALPGRIQFRNAAGVLALVEALGDNDLLDAATIDSAFSQLRLEGRCQQIERRRRWIIDVAHNPAAARVLADILAEAYAGEALTCVIGVLGDKDVEGIVEALGPLVGRWIAVTANGPRAIPAAELARRIANASNSPCRIEPSIAAACAFADALADGPVLVTGSFMTVGPAIEWIESSAA